jgi:hypothetical protein
MFFRVIRKIAQRHFFLHLLIPLAVGLLIEYRLNEFVVFVWSHGGRTVFEKLKNPAPVLGVVGTYLVVMYFVLRRETAIGMERIRSTRLEEALKDATGFFGVGAIRLREWFEPSPQVYLATIMKRKIEKIKKGEDFTYDRVLIFSKSAFRDLDSQYLNGYYAKALIDLHDAHGIGLGYLEPKEMDLIMEGFEVDEGKAIGYYPRWLPDWLLKVTPRSWRRIWNRRLALAVVYYGEKKRFLPFSKRGVIVDVGEIADAITDEDRNKAYEKLVSNIKDKVFEGSNIKAEHDFRKFF